MARNGRGRVLTADEFAHLINVIQEHRYPEKNTAIMQVSFKLGLRVQEIALLEVGDVAIITPGRDVKLLQSMVVRACTTKGANALGRKSTYRRKTVSFSVTEFERVLKQVATMAKAGVEIIASDFHPDPRPKRGRTRDLPMVDPALRASLDDYLSYRLASPQGLSPGDPLFITQQGSGYTPNALQEHMALMLRGWAGLERAKSHSGRRTLLTTMIHGEGLPLSIAQKTAGHISGATTLIYTEPTDMDIGSALKASGNHLEK